VAIAEGKSTLLDAPRMPPLADPFVDGVRRGMTGPGFFLVDTSQFFGDDSFRGFKRSNLVLPFDREGWGKFPQFARYACWLEQLLVRALPEESALFAALEFRHERAGLVAEEVDRLHADGSYIRSIYTLYGPTTVYRDGDVESSVPHGHTLLITAVARARPAGVPCTLHRRPGAGPERAVIVCSFERRGEHPHRLSLYRQVGAAGSRR
jgi:hypothetical protein